MPYIETIRNMLTPLGGVTSIFAGSTGGTITTTGGYRYHTFATGSTSSGTYTFIPSGSGTISYLIVAGGGGGGQFGGGGQSLFEQRIAESTTHGGHDDGPQGTHGTALGWRGDTQEDRAQHQEDQQQRGNQHESDAFSYVGKQAHACCLVDDGQHKCQQHTTAQRHHDGFILGWIGTSTAFEVVHDGWIALRQVHGGQTTQNRQQQQREQAGFAVVFADGAG